MGLLIFVMLHVRLTYTLIFSCIIIYLCFCLRAASVKAFLRRQHPERVDLMETSGKKQHVKALSLFSNYDSL